MPPPCLLKIKCRLSRNIFSNSRIDCSEVIHDWERADLLLTVRSIGVTMIGCGGRRPVRGGSRNDAATWPELFLAGRFRATRIHFCLALVIRFEFLDRNQLRQGPIRVGMNLLNLVVLLLR